jgi:hypothetical protein
VQATRWVDRWPDVIVVPLKPVSVEPPQPLSRTILVVIAIITLSVSLIVVAFGGMIDQRKPKTRDRLLHMTINLGPERPTRLAVGISPGSRRP